MAVRRFSHIAIRVSDLERSRRFYREALEFRELSDLEIQGGPTARWLEKPDLGLHAVFLERDGTQVELQVLDLPKPDERAGYNTIGLAHIGLRVDDVEAVTQAVCAHGGEVIERSRYRNEALGSHVVFIADPDGTWIELIQALGDPEVPPGEPLA